MAKTMSEDLLPVHVVEDSSDFRFGGLFLWTNLILSGLGASTNFRSAFKIWRTFNLKLALYLIIFLDAAITTLGYVLVFAATLTFLADPGSQTRIGCNFFIGGVFIAQTLGPFLLSLISILRHNIMVNAITEARKRACFYLVTCLTVLSVVYLGSYIVIVNYSNVPTIAMLELCVRGEEARSLSPMVILIAIPNQLSVLATIIYDVRTYLYIRKHANNKKDQQSGDNNSSNNSEQQRILAVSQLLNNHNSSNSPTKNPSGPNKRELENQKMLQIPLRATVLSLLFGLVTLSFTIFSSKLITSNVTRAYLFWYLGAILCVIRNPVVAAVVFKSNETNKAATQAAIREELRRKEILHALKEREIWSTSNPKQQSQQSKQSQQQHPNDIVTEIDEGEKKAIKESLSENYLQTTHKISVGVNTSNDSSVSDLPKIVV